MSGFEFFWGFVVEILDFQFLWGYWFLGDDSVRSGSE